MSLTNMFDSLQSCEWVDINPSQCGCKGQGFLFSDLDTTHRCPLHGAGVPHPNEYDVEEGRAVPEFDYVAHLLDMRRLAWASFRSTAGMPEQEFRARVVSFVGKTPSTPEAWVDAAQAFVRQLPPKSRPVARPPEGRW